jgi:hypothetical protein
MLQNRNKIMVVAGELPRPSLISQAFLKTDYADAYTVELPLGRDYTLTEVAVLFLTTSLPWEQQLMTLRNWLVRPFGLKTGQADGGQAGQKITFEPGTQAGFFRVYQQAAQEILLGEDDYHLDFRLSILLIRHNDRQFLTVSTIVKHNNWLGRAYFLPVRLFHRLIVPATMRNLVTRCQPTTA